MTPALGRWYSPHYAQQQPRAVPEREAAQPGSRLDSRIGWSGVKSGCNSGSSCVNRGINPRGAPGSGLCGTYVYLCLCTLAPSARLPNTQAKPVRMTKPALSVETAIPLDLSDLVRHSPSCPKAASLPIISLLPRRANQSRRLRTLCDTRLQPNSTA